MGAAITYICLFISLYFEVFMLLSFLERRTITRLETTPSDETYLPTVAIVVPCWNEAKTLAGTIQSLFALEYPKEKLEIIIVDDGSTDNTRAVAQEVGRTFFGEDYLSEANSAAGKSSPHFPQLKIFHKQNGGKHTAMNYALARTNAEFIGCLDADSVVDKHALQHIVTVFQNEKVAAVTPGILIKKPETILQYMQDAEYRLSVFNRFTLAALGSAFITPGPFSIFRTSVVRDTGGWRHGHSTEDMEMALRMQDAGYLIANAPRAQVYTGTPRTIPKLFSQRVRWTYGFLRNAIDYRHMFGNHSFGNLGILILPTALLSIAIAIFFFVRVVFFEIISLGHTITRIQVMGFNWHPSLDAFYLSTSAMFFLIIVAIALVIGLISVGTFIGSGKRLPPIGTPLFVLFYSFLVPVWLGTAVVRALFKTGVKWR